MGELPIVEVVVHRDGALVHRRGTLPVGPGGVVVKGLPLVLEESSLRVEVVGATPSGWRLTVDVDGLERGSEPAADRALYEDTKRELTSRQWPDMNAYADAKTDVIEAIKARAREQVG